MLSKDHVSELKSKIKTLSYTAALNLIYENVKTNRISRKQFVELIETTKEMICLYD